MGVLETALLLLNLGRLDIGARQQESFARTPLERFEQFPITMVENAVGVDVRQVVRFEPAGSQSLVSDGERVEVAIRRQVVIHRIEQPRLVRQTQRLVQALLLQPRAQRGERVEEIERMPPFVGHRVRAGEFAMHHERAGRTMRLADTAAGSEYMRSSVKRSS